MIPSEGQPDHPPLAYTINQSSLHLLYYRNTLMNVCYVSLPMIVVYFLISCHHECRQKELYVELLQFCER